MPDYPYRWRVRTRLPTRFGQPCRVLARGKMNSALVEFEDGFKVITSRNYFRKKEKTMQDEPKEQWAIVNLMGHAQTAGRIELGTLLRVDVPVGDTYRTSFYGVSAIYSIDIVSEEIARAYAPRAAEVLAYDAPVVTKEQYNATTTELRAREDRWHERTRELIKQLNALGIDTSVRASLPEPEQVEDFGEGE